MVFTLFFSTCQKLNLTQNEWTYEKPMVFRDFSSSGVETTGKKKALKTL